jgi:fructokinase
MGLERGAIIIYDPNFRRAHLAELEELKPRIIENINYADIVRGSDEDFYLIFGAERPEKVREIIDNETKLLLYTQNTDNVKVFLNSLEASIPAEKIKAVSTIGAGDNFNAGIIHWLLKNGTTRAGLQLLQEEDLGDMAGTGIKFATNVCLGFDNYISHDFARGILGG